MAPLESFSAFTEQLTQKLTFPLPGETAHQLMQASSRLRLTFKPNARTRKSAVLILFYPYQNEVYFKLIISTEYDG